MPYSASIGVRVWDSNDGRSLVDVELPVNSLLWCDNNHLVVLAKDSKIKRINAATGSTVSEWPVPYINPYTSLITQLQHGTFVAYSANETVTFWDTATQAQLGLIRHTHGIRSIAPSSDGQFLAIVTERKIIVKELLRSISGPELDIDSAALDAWILGQLTCADELLSVAITTAESSIYRVLASRALVRARLGEWDAALVDANESIEIHPSLIGYVAKFVALVGKGERDEGIQVYDLGYRHFHSDLLPLIKAVVLYMAGEHLDAISHMDGLITDAQVDPALYVVQAYMHLLRGNVYMENSDYEHAIQSFENARIRLRNRARQPPLIISLISGWEFDSLTITIQQRLCEALFAAGRTTETCQSVLRMADEDTNIAESIKTQISDFKHRFCSNLEELGDSAVNARQYNEAVSQYTVALSLYPPSPQGLLVKRSNAWASKGAWGNALDDVKKWARLMLTSNSWKDTLAAAVDFMLERFVVYWAICDDLEMTGRVTDAVACFHQISGEPAQEIDGELANWTRDFKSRWRVMLEDLGDRSIEDKQCDEAVSQYTAALLLDPIGPQNLLVKRSHACAEKGNWEDALNDANEVIKLDPSSPSGYERKHAALHGMGRHGDALDAFEEMLLKISESSDPEIREQSHHYVLPEMTREAIRTSIEDVVHDLPLVLIHVLSGRLCNKSEQITAFESTPAFTKLLASMTTYVDQSLVTQVVGESYRYATLSHTWEANEPLYQEVVKTVVYDLEASPTREKLRMFCETVRDEGFNWAWSDTCCVDKGDVVVLQESLVSMFRWYQGSAMTIVFLSDVDRLAELGALTRSRWNSRAWALQEYHASRVVRFYTKDWTPYLDLTIYNHKESPEIISEMEKATGISAQSLMALRPGLNYIREKLRLTSTRQTTLVEDATYSLLGIFSMTIPVAYGEGDKSLGRLLSQLLSSSGDTSILAWNGKSSSFNSCLPESIIVFSQPLTSHVPTSTLDTKMKTTTRELYTSSLDPILATRLYDQLHDLSTPTFAGQRMSLPCLTFQMRLVSTSRTGSEFVFRVQAGILGAVEIKTREDLSRLDSLYLVHPWIDFLLDLRDIGNIEEIAPDDGETSDTDEYPSFTSFPDLCRDLYANPVDDVSPSSPTRLTMDTQIRVYEFLTRLRQPFGALLLAPTQQNATEYRRIATESLIRVQVEEVTSATLDELIQAVQVLDVL